MNTENKGLEKKIRQTGKNERRKEESGKKENGVSGGRRKQRKREKGRMSWKDE